MVFATRGKTHHKYHCFWASGAQKNIGIYMYLRCFLLQRENATYLTIFSHYETQKKLQG